MKHAFLTQLRSDSCYPTFRGFVRLLKGLSIVAACIVSIVGALSGNTLALVLSVVGGVVIILVAFALAEATSMLADIADATLEAHAPQLESVPLDVSALRDVPRGNEATLRDLARGGTTR